MSYYHPEMEQCKSSLKSRPTTTTALCFESQTSDYALSTNYDHKYIYVNQMFYMLLCVFLITVFVLVSTAKCSLPSCKKSTMWLPAHFLIDRYTA